MTAAEIASQIKEEAKQLGFSLVGIAPAARPDTLDFLHQWLAEGHAGEMGYMERRKTAYDHPTGVLPGVRSLIFVGLNYFHDENESPHTGIGRIAKYAAGSADYHDLIRSKLKSLSAVLHKSSPECRSRVIVDTAPLLERDFARIAGLGWFGKNTMLINKWEGSYFFLGGILTDIELPPDQPHLTDHCGTCTRCLDACPTDAFEAPYALDARKCISYLTIELRGQPIPESLRSGMEDWLFGCDVCQDVCPWNRKATNTNEPALLPDFSSARDAATFLLITEQEFWARYKRTPFSRPNREGMARNAAIVLGNSGDDRWTPALKTGLDDSSPLVRGASAWALGKILNTQTRKILVNRRVVETDDTVLSEIDRAIRPQVEH